MAQRPLTERQKEVLAAIRSHIERHGHSPTIRELCAVTGLKSTNGVVDHLRALRRKGAIEWPQEMKSRTIRLPRPDSRYLVLASKLPCSASELRQTLVSMDEQTRSRIRVYEVASGPLDAEQISKIVSSARGSSCEEWGGCRWL